MFLVHLYIPAPLGGSTVFDQTLLKSTISAIYNYEAINVKSATQRLENNRI
jgi:hypothetical protein